MVELTYPILLDTIRTLGIIVGIFYYLMTLRNQNKTRRGALLMQTYARVDSPERIRSLHNVFRWNFNNFEEFLEKYGPENEQNWEYYTNTHIFIEGLGAMVRMKYIDIEDVAALLGGGIVRYWDLLEPIKEGLAEIMYPRWHMETEYMYNEMIKFSKKHPELKIYP